MKHCVGSYSDSVQRGQYLVYSITIEGKRYSTLGVNITNNGKNTEYSFSQHYKKCNAQVDCTDVKDLANLLVEQLNRNSQEEPCTTQ